MKPSGLLTFLTLLATGAFGQSMIITGSVLDSEDQPLAFANVLLLAAGDSALVSGELTDDDGRFSLTVAEPGSYRVRAELIGFSKVYAPPFTYVGGEKIDLPAFVLNSGIELDEITVSATKPLIEMSANKMIINVGNSSIQAGNTALEVLKRSPGVSLDNSNVVSLRGRSGVLITINGKNQYLSGAEVAQLLETTPASNIERIEIIANPSARYDAQGNSGIINIVLKESQVFGTNGQASSTVRQGLRNSHFHSLNVNHRRKKLALRATGEYYDFAEYRRLNLIRNIPSEKGLTNFDQVTDMETRRVGINLNLAADYTIGERTTIGLQTRQNYGDRIETNDNETKITGVQDLGFDRLDVKAPADENSHNVTYNVNLDHKFGNQKAGLTFDADYNTFARDKSINYQTVYITEASQSSSPPSLLNNTQAVDVDIFAVKSDFSYTVSDAVAFEAGFKYSNVMTTNATIFESVENGVPINQPGRTNTFAYREAVLAGYTTVKVNWGKLGVQGGLRVENTNSKGTSPTLGQTVSRSYLNLFPSLSITHPLGEGHQMSYNYSYRLDRPNYGNLNPFEVFLDDFTRGRGNPFLNPQYTHSLGVNYAWENRLYVSADYSRTTDQISQVIEQNSAENLTISTFANLDNFTNISLTISIPKVWSEVFTSRLNYTGFYNEFLSPVQAGLLDNSAISHRVYLSNEFTLGNDWTAEVSANYESRAVHGFFTADPRGSLDVGVGKKFGDKLQVKVGASDLLRTLPTRYYVNTGEIDLIDDSLFDSRRVQLTLTYSFGNGRVNSVREREAAGAKEQSRL